MDLEEIQMHHAFARYYGEKSSCGTKIKHKTEEKAADVAVRMSSKTGRNLEAYPCPFCNFWHTGRAMGIVEKEIFSDPEFRDRVPPKITEWENTDGMKHHALSHCEGTFCTIHNPSNHKMRDCEVFWDFQKWPVTPFRICEHTHFHPDADHINWLSTWMKNELVQQEKEHECDGCCDIQATA